MEKGGPPRPRVSRETRLLFITVLISLVTLWVLARIRFPDRPETPNPVPPLLTQLADRPRFEDLAARVAEIESRLVPPLLALELQQASAVGDRPDVQDIVPALRIRDDVAVTLLTAARGADTPRPTDLAVLARDTASGLAVVRVPPAPAPAPVAWAPQRMQYPRYLMVSNVSRQGTSLRPVFVGSLYPTASPTWSESIWVVPARTDLATGAFVFTTDGALAGLAIEHAGRPAILPAEAVIRAADRLLREGSRDGGWLGVDVQPLTPAVGVVAGATGGMIVTWVDPRGPAAKTLVVTDVIEAIDSEVVATLEHWEARMARLTAGDALALHVRRRGEAREIRLTAGAPPEPPVAPLLGLTMRAAPRVGVEIVRVDPGSAAARAGIEAGDVVTLIGEIERPTPAQVTRAFLATPDDRPLLVGVTRGDRHRVLALGKR
ncbi:MAG: PDZ domain-containing protein [Acidobacteria bacterium]|nr:PDZ domain-containing protein [Acidobacteriota bacterium]